MKFNIAIDGPSAAGKSTIARYLARKYNLIHLDTGAMYRAVALKALREHADVNKEDEIVNVLKNADISMDVNGQIFLNGENITALIRTEEISWNASTLSKHAKVRQDLVKRQQDIAKEKGYILDGRDIGTVVLPDAEVKIFLTASSDARAKRRYQEYLEKGIEVNYEQVLNDIKQRDIQDSTRANSPLVIAEDGIEVDTSDLDIEEVIDKINDIIKEKIEVNV